MRKKAFTLIELLVVVSIIALLIAILLPSLKQAQSVARMTVCLSNQRQIGLADAQYINDYGAIASPCSGPNVPDFNGPGSADTLNAVGLFYRGKYILAPTVKGWAVTATTPITTGNSVYRCPEGRSDALLANGGGIANYGTSLDDPVPWRPYRYHVATATYIDSWYGYNAYTDTTDKSPFWRVIADTEAASGVGLSNCSWPTINRIRMPSLTVYLFDGAASIANPQYGYKINPRHGQIVDGNGDKAILNILFFDGHAEPMPYTKVPPPGVSPTIMSWNNTNLNNINPQVKWFLTQ